MILLFLDLPMWAHHLLRRVGVPAAYTYCILTTLLAWYWCVPHPYLTFALLVTVAIILYARFIEPRWLHIKHTAVTIDLSHPLKVAVLSDLHVSCYKGKNWVERIVRETVALQPDLVLITGDMVNNQFPKDTEVNYLHPLAKLKRFPVYYVLGNHDYGTGKPDHHCFEDRSDEVKTAMKKLGIPLLQNELVRLTINKQPIVLFGTDDLWSRPVHYQALEKWDKKTPLLFAVHNPDTVMTWPNEYPKPTFTFGGHSHGGQFEIFGFPLGSATMELGRKCYKGLHDYHGIPFYVSVGLGESTIPFRFGVRPELSLITLKPKTAA